MLHRSRWRLVLVTALMVATLGLAAPSALAQSCTGQAIPAAAQAEGAFGREVVAPTARFLDNIGQQVIRPEATAPHDACPAPPP